MAKVDNTRPDPREAELVEEMTLDAMEYIHGKGTKTLVDMLKNSTEQSATLASFAYMVVRQAAEKHQATATVEMDMDMLMGVATETIDMAYEVAEAAGQVIPGSDVKRGKEDTLLKLTVMHGENIKGDQPDYTPEQKQAAATDLRDYMSDGGTQKAFNYLNTRAKQEGLNPLDMMRAGNEAALGSKHPISDAVKKGIAGLQKARSEPMPDTPPLMGGPRTDPVPAPMPEEESALMPPQGEGIVPSGMPPEEDPNAEIAPPPERRY